MTIADAARRALSWHEGHTLTAEDMPALRLVVEAGRLVEFALNGRDAPPPAESADRGAAGAVTLGSGA